MLIHELTEKECRQVLAGTNLGRLACAQDNQPYVVPIYFAADGDDLYSFATVGRKIEWMRTNPKVCVEVDDITDQFHWTTVVAIGRYEELTHATVHEAIKLRAQALFQKRPEWWFPGAARTKGTERHVPVIFRIRIDYLSGRRAAKDTVHVVSKPKPKPHAKAPRWWSDVLQASRSPKKQKG
jgi:nitroimidazol reductase NimA-like FMN-containing flavoprotein (pyridoxamine 5'-phosphate oxidase superfamily)